jgi:hypothetical protein
MKKIDLKVLLGENTDFTSEQAELLTEKINKLIEAQVDTRVSVQQEILESEIKEKYDTLLEEREGVYTENLKTLEEGLLARATAFKDLVVEKTDTIIESYKAQKDGEVEQFKAVMESRLDSYLDLELKKAIPDSHIEALAKVSVLEPIVEGFKKVMQENYIKFDEESFGLLKDARSEIINLRKQLSGSVNESMDLTKKLNESERIMKISEVCEGLTQAQYERACKLLEGYDADEVAERFNLIRDVILETADASKKDEDEETDETETEGGEAPAKKVSAKKNKEEAEAEECDEGEVAQQNEMEAYATRFRKLING